jgi:hypothetical protein
MAVVHVYETNPGKHYRVRYRTPENRHFMDIDNIPIGHDFVEVINERFAQRRVVIVVIGRLWLNCIGPKGGRRLDDPKDFVRSEIEHALTRPRDVTVIPL